MFKKIIKNIYFGIKKLPLKKRNIIIESNVSFMNTKFSVYNRICKNTYINNSSIGKCTYIGRNTILSNTTIGSFSSIGPFTEVIYGTHPIDFVSTNPAFYSIRKQSGITFVNENKFDEFNFVGKTTKSVIIGNDVWIGYGVKIIEGVSIGDGAVVLAGAVVAKDVEPYSVVGGVPAKHIKYRFDDETREMLLDFCWWEKDFEWLQNHAYLFLNIDDFTDFIKRESHV
jgi:acetyltransferase-like isoleucine patch superfamily enzyme